MLRKVRFVNINEDLINILFGSVFGKRIQIVASCDQRRLGVLLTYLLFGKMV